MRHTQTTTRTIATTALAAVAVFPTIVIALNLAQRSDGYHASRQAISELALGRAGWLMAIAFCALALGTYLLAVLIRRTTERAVVAPALLTLAAALSVVSAVFHTDLLGATTTVHGRIHNDAGVVTFLSLLIAMGISSYRFRTEPAWRSFAVPTLAFTVVGMVAFFLVPTLGDQHFGIAQRLLVGTFVGWILAATAHARHIGEPRAERADASSRHADASA
jgi:hypothetical protein